MDNPAERRWLPGLLAEPRSDYAADLFSFILALVAGSTVGAIWWILHKMYFVQLYWTVVSGHYADFPYAGFDWAFMLINLEFALLQGMTVGLVTAFFARRHPYWSAVAALALAFAFKYLIHRFVLMLLLVDLVFGHGLGLSFVFGSTWQPPNVDWQMVFFGVYLSSLFCGTFVGQLFRRSYRRGAGDIKAAKRV